MFALAEGIVKHEPIDEKHYREKNQIFERIEEHFQLIPFRLQKYYKYLDYATLLSFFLDTQVFPLYLQTIILPIPPHEKRRKTAFPSFCIAH